MKKGTALLIIMMAILIASHSNADDSTVFVARVSPDALIILDMSGSMVWDPAGNMDAVYPNRRIDVARRVLRDLLDDNDDNQIDDKDRESLNIRLGYMRFWNSIGNDDSEPKTGDIIVLSDIGSSYRDIWTMAIDPGTDEFGALVPRGGTPLAASLVEAKTYFMRDVNPNDSAIKCRQKFIILITDGADTWSCKGDGSRTTPQMRMLTVQRAMELNKAGIKVFVVGLGGNLPLVQQRTLNWAARYGGTYNPSGPYSGDPAAYDVRTYLPSKGDLDACSSTSDSVALDPASYELSGFAFLAPDAAELSKSLKTILNYISEHSYSFSSPAVAASRISDNNHVYLSSFKPKEGPFWEGYLRKYQISQDGTLPLDSNGNPTTPLWDASDALKRTSPEDRKIYVNLDNSITPKEFKAAYVPPASLGLANATERDNLIGHIRGYDAYNFFGNGSTKERPWKLGDVFHSNAVIVGSPSSHFEDEGYSGANGFYATYKDRKKIVIVGANDGMLHAFDGETGNETWAFIPNAILKRLYQMRFSHTYYIDSSPKVADVWFYSNPTDSNKSLNEWHTVLICGYRRGYDKGMNMPGYFALDITDTENPKFLWEFPKTQSDIDKIGESWSEPVIGRVKIEVGDKLYERWVAFIGGGYVKGERFDESPGGRSFFVIDIQTGDIVWQYYFLNGTGEKHEMRWGLASTPAAVDTNFDGFMDKVYIGDLGGQMWVFDVSADELNRKSISQWSGQRFFASTAGQHPIYYPPAVVFDDHGLPWVFFGTGDRENPTDQKSEERFYAVKDNGIGNYPYAESDLTEVTDMNTFNPDPLKKGLNNKGWFIKLKSSEKVLTRPSVFNNIVYFTTYVLLGNKQDECSVGGTARLYLVEYLSGGGATEFAGMNYLSNGTSSRYLEIGQGLSSAPIITVDSKGEALLMSMRADGGLYSRPIYSGLNRKQILYWREIGP